MSIKAFDNEVRYLYRGVRYISNVVILRDLSRSLYIAFHGMFQCLVYITFTIHLKVYHPCPQAIL